MQSILIVGGALKEREEKAKQLVDPSTSQFDVTEIPAVAFGIADVRKLIHSISLKPALSEQKAIIIHEAQALTIEAQNAMLKTLEEPPENTSIILTTSNQDLLLPTIVSRCKVIQLTTSEALTNEVSISSKQLQSFFQTSLSEKLKLAQDFSKTREDATYWLEGLIVAARTSLLENLDPRYGKLLNALQKAHLALKTTNVNPRLALENLLLSLFNL